MTATRSVAEIPLLHQTCDVSDTRPVMCRILVTSSVGLCWPCLLWRLLMVWPLPSLFSCGMEARAVCGK